MFFLDFTWKEKNIIFWCFLHEALLLRAFALSALHTHQIALYIRKGDEHMLIYEDNMRLLFIGRMYTRIARRFFLSLSACESRDTRSLPYGLINLKVI